MEMSGSQELGLGSGKEAGAGAIKRDQDSVDDFEHLEPVKDAPPPPDGFDPFDRPLQPATATASATATSKDFLSELQAETESRPPPVGSLIDNEAFTASNKPATKEVFDEMSDFFGARSEPEPPQPKPLVGGESFSFSKPLPKEPFDEVSDFLKAEAVEVIKPPTSNLFDIEDKKEEVKPAEPEANLYKDFSDLAPEEEVSPISKPKSLAEGDFDIPPPIPKHQNLNDDSPMDAFEPSQTPEPEFDIKPSERIIEEKPTPVEPTPKPKEEPSIEFTSDIGAKDLFCKYGLDAWFTPERLHPRVESLVYWREPKKSGVVFGVLLVSLLSLAYCSLISVVAYLCLFTISVTIAFRIYKNVMQAVQKTSDGHPFKEWLEIDLTVPEDKVKELAVGAVAKINCCVTELRRLFLVEDLVDSIKFSVVLWALTYVGAWFNGLTLVIIGVIAIFSLPKVYENNKAQVDSYLALCTSKISDITNKVRAAVPMGKKEADKKEQ